MTERELIIKALNIIRECFINIENGRGAYNRDLAVDLNECVLDLEALPD